MGSVSSEKIVIPSSISGFDFEANSLPRILESITSDDAGVSNLIGRVADKTGALISPVTLAQAESHINNSLANHIDTSALDKLFEGRTNSAITTPLNMLDQRVLHWQDEMDKINKEARKLAA